MCQLSLWPTTSAKKSASSYSGSYVLNLYVHAACFPNVDLTFRVQAVVRTSRCQRWVFDNYRIGGRCYWRVANSDRVRRVFPAFQATATTAASLRGASLHPTNSLDNGSIWSQAGTATLSPFHSTPTDTLVGSGMNAAGSGKHSSNSLWVVAVTALFIYAFIV